MSKKPIYMRTESGEVFSTTMQEYHKDCTRLPQKEGEALYKKQIRSSLLEWLKPGDTVYCVLRSVSSSGMSRRISLFAIHDNQLISLDYRTSILTGNRLSEKGGIVVGGCGMDMGFHLVYCLGAALWPDGTPEPHGSRNGKPDEYGGYALKSTWI
jgi:hypothetical protein